MIENPSSRFQLGKVSICVPTYNRPNLISVLLDSVLSQTYRNFEIIITDNSENFETKDIVESRYDDARIRYFKNDKNLGMGGNAVRTFGFVTGEYFTFTPDDDVWLDPTKLKRQVELLNRRSDLNIVYSNAKSIDYDGSTLPEFSTVNEDAQDLTISAEELLPGRNTDYFLNILTALLRTKPLLPIFDESFHFESEEYLCYYIGAVEKRIGFIAKPLVALREAEHFRTAIEDGKIVDWKKRKDIRIRQLFGILSAIGAFHPDTKTKLETPEVQNAIGRHLLSTAKAGGSYRLLAITLCACYLNLRKFSLAGAIAHKTRTGKTFG